MSHPMAVQCQKLYTAAKGKNKTSYNNCDLVRIIKVVLTINPSLRLHFQTYKLCTEFDNKLDEVCSCVE